PTARRISSLIEPHLDKGKEGGACRLPAGDPLETDERDDPGPGTEAEHHRPTRRIHSRMPLDRHGRGDDPARPPHPLPRHRGWAAGKDQASHVFGRDPAALRLDVDKEPARRGAGKGSRLSHGRPRSMLMAYWWFRVRRTVISRTARPWRRITSATARGTRKSGTNETFISSGADVPV